MAILVLRPSTSVDAIDRAINRSDCNRSMYTHWMQSRILSSFLQWHLAMKMSIFLLLVFVLLFLSRSGYSGFTSIEIDRWVDQSIGCYKSSIRVGLAARPVRQGIIWETSGKRVSQTSKQKGNRAKHFGWHWLFKRWTIQLTTIDGARFVFSFPHW